MLSWRSEVDVRSGKAGDAEALATLFAETWRGAYRGLIPELSLESIIRRRGKSWWANALRGGESMLIIEMGGKVTGYATYGIARMRSAYQGEIYELYIDPAYQGLGLGEHLFEACRARLDRRALNGLVVWTLTGNTLARDFYWRRGGRPFARVEERFSGAILEKIAYGWP